LNLLRQPPEEPKLLERPIKRILFVCLGNQCRSPMAEYLFKQILAKSQNSKAKEIVITSASTGIYDGAPASRKTIEVMRRRGIDLSGFRAKQVTPELIDWADLILAMDRRNKKAIIKMLPDAAAKTFTLKEYAGNGDDPDVEDPVGQPIEQYEKCANEIEDALIKVNKKLTGVLEMKCPLKEGEVKRTQKYTDELNEKLKET